MNLGRKSRFVTVGRARRPHGVRGELLVEPLTDVVDRFAPGARLELVGEDGTQRRLEIKTVRPHRGQLLVRFHGVEDRDAAAELRSATLAVEENEVPSAPEGAFYYFELVGCICSDAKAGVLGPVEEVIEDGGGLLLSLDVDGKSLLVPFVHDFIRDIDLDRRSIDLDLPQGLLELCMSRS